MKKTSGSSPVGTLAFVTIALTSTVTALLPMSAARFSETSGTG